MRDAVPTTVSVVVRGDVSDDAVAYAREKLARVAAHVGAPVPFARLRLTRLTDPAVDRPVLADVALDVRGEIVRAHVRGRHPREAADLLEERLRDRLTHRAQHRKGRRHAAPPGGHNPGDAATRPPDDLAVVPHAAFAMFDETAEEAAEDLDALGYRFHLFRDLASGSDALIERVDHGHRVTLAVSAPRMRVSDAVERLAATGEAFVFFREEATRRGNVLYRRDDGQFGLLTPGPR